VIGKADVAFKTTGKVILQKDGALFWIQLKERSRSITRLYQRRKGPHQPSFLEKAKAPNQFTEATLLRAMETWKRWTMKIYANWWKKMVLDVRQHERILLKRYLNVNTSLEIKTGVTNGDWDSVDWYHSKWFGKSTELTGPGKSS
jgi:hypothetical protein